MGCLDGKANTDCHGLIPKGTDARMKENFLTGLDELIVRIPEGAYPIWLGPGVAGYTGALLAGLTDSRRCAVVTNPTVAQFHAEMLLTSLRTGGFA